MKEFALVYTTHYQVIPYATWWEHQRGYVMETSDDREYLEAEAETRNLILSGDIEDDYEDEMRYDQGLEFEPYLQQ